MPIFKAPNDDTCLADTAPSGWVEITQSELDAIRESRTAASPKVFTPLTPRQIRQALTIAGLRTSVETTIAAGDQNTKDWWEYALTIERNHPMVEGMATALGQTSAQVDALFELGAQL